MSPESETSSSPTETSSQNTAIEASSQTNGEPRATHSANTPSEDFEEKVYALEQELLATRSAQKRERYVHIFFWNLIGITYAGTQVPGYVFATLVVASIIIQIALAHLWDFPWVVKPLGRWLQILERRLSQTKHAEEENESE